MRLTNDRHEELVGPLAGMRMVSGGPSGLEPKKNYELFEKGSD